MDLKHKNDSELLSELKTLGQEERAVVHKILHHLREVEMRKLYLAEGYSSLFSFCMGYLNLTKDEAQLRIQAVRLLTAVPEVEEKIKSGAIGLSVAAKAQSAFRQEDKRRREEKSLPLSKEEKKQILNSIESHSTRDADRVLAAHFPLTNLMHEKTKPVDAKRTMIQFVADERSMEKYERLKCLLAHKNFAGRWDLLFDELADIALEKIDPIVKQEKALKRQLGKQEITQVKQAAKQELPLKKEAAMNKSAHTGRTRGAPANQDKAKDQTSIYPQTGKSAQKNSPPEEAAKPIAAKAITAKPHHRGGAKRGTGRKSLSVHLKRALFTKADWQCEWVNQKTGQRCPSKHALQIDHVRPLGLGGGDEPENLRVLCSEHNRYQAWKIWGDRRDRQAPK